MDQRREFLKTSLCGGVSWLALSGLRGVAAEIDKAGDAPYRLTRDVPTRRFDGETCWFHPRAGIVPGAGRNGQLRIVMTLNTFHLAGNDVFKAMYGISTDDLGKSWTKPKELDALAVRYETIGGQRSPVAVSDFWPTWHAASKTLLGIGHTVVYTPDWKILPVPRPRHTSYALYDPERRAWQPWQKMEMPDDEPDKFFDCGAGSTQRYDLEDGTILLPLYFRPPDRSSCVMVARCSFDGKTLKYVSHGNELSIDDKTRGLHEPSLTRFDGTYYLTIRNDLRAYVTSSRDGVHFEPIRPWTFDDGKDLGSYNTQAHWVTHSDALFLVYTRRGANNDHVFRHRAPLFMAQVDPKKMCVIRATEQILVPERGVRLGNFGVTYISPEETWVTVAEGMAPRSVENRGSDGSVWVARIHWNKPNRIM
jgi:hypothetical protein